MSDCGASEVLRRKCKNFRVLSAFYSPAIGTGSVIILAVYSAVVLPAPICTPALAMCNVHPRLDKISTSKLKNLRGVEQIVNPVFISHRHIQKKNRSCQSKKKKMKKKGRQKKASPERRRRESDESDDRFIVCKHCVGWFLKWGDHRPVPLPQPSPDPPTLFHSNLPSAVPSKMVRAV